MAASLQPVPYPQIPGTDWTRPGKTITVVDDGFVTGERGHVAYAYHPVSP
jgi:hypothetical protein